MRQEDQAVALERGESLFIEIRAPQGGARIEDIQLRVKGRVILVVRDRHGELFTRVVKE